MSDGQDIFRPKRPKITPEDLAGASEKAGDPLESVKAVRQSIAQEGGEEFTMPLGEASPVKISGNVPAEFIEVMKNRKSANVPNVPAFNTNERDDDGFETFEAPPERSKVQNNPIPVTRPVKESDALESLLKKLADHHSWEEFEFPSKGKFYSDIPPVIHVRAMTGEEEQILATPRWVKKGKAIDMIFRRCIKEPINTENLLSSDRTHLLIYLRGISYTPEYDVEIKCPHCSIQFAHVINLDELEVQTCPDDFAPESLTGVLPVSKFRYTYRLATGQDEQDVSLYRERRIREWGDQSDDDTLLYRTALLLEEIEGVVMKKELALLLKRLPIQDVGHLRNEINTPPFGVDTELTILCPSCTESFKIDLPLETNFFFPRKKQTRTQA